MFQSSYSKRGRCQLEKLTAESSYVDYPYFLGAPANGITVLCTGP